MSIKFFYQIADVVTMVALAALLICLIIVVAQKKGQESKYDRKIKAAAAYIAVFFVILAGAALIMTSAGYSALKNRVKEACPGAHSFHSIEKDCVSFIDGDGNKCFFEYDQDKTKLFCIRKATQKLKKLYSKKESVINGGSFFCKKISNILKTNTRNGKEKRYVKYAARYGFSNEWP